MEIVRTEKEINQVAPSNDGFYDFCCKKGRASTIRI